VFNELLKRSAGDSGMTRDSISHVTEYVSGKKATPSDPDMANHHICKFTINVLERLITSVSYPELCKRALKLIILFDADHNAMTMGGEFLGLAAKIACGGEEFKNSKDATKFLKFIKLEGGLASVGREICNSGDPHQFLQKRLCMVTPQD
jgi:hypothetical protein